MRCWKHAAGRCCPTGWGARFCTAELKVLPARNYLRWLGWETWTSVVGIRRDEKERREKMLERAASGKDGSHETLHFPLYDAGVRKRDVSLWSRLQPFDLDLPDNDGTTPLGNCAVCFLKSERTKAYVARYYPEYAERMARREDRVTAQVGYQAKFDRRCSMRELIDHAQKQPDWVFSAESEHFCATTLGGCHD